MGTKKASPTKRNEKPHKFYTQTHIDALKNTSIHI